MWKSVCEALSNSAHRFAFVANHTHAAATIARLRAAHEPSPLLEETVLSDAQSTDKYLGQTIFSGVHASDPQSTTLQTSENLTKLLAGRALTHARHFTENGFGLASFLESSSFSAPAEKSSPGNNLCLALWSPTGIFYNKIVIDKNEKIEKCVDGLMLSVLAKYFFNIIPRDKIAGLQTMEKVEETQIGSLLNGLSSRNTKHVLVTQNGKAGCEKGEIDRIVNGHKLVLLPGSFNPLHEGHVRILDAATRTCLTENQTKIGIFPAFELSVFNVDKHPLSEPVMAHRASQFAGRFNVLVTNAPTFVEKSRLFQGAIFVVGYDTAVRIIQKKYYGDSEENMEKALHEFRDNGCIFMVAGRLVEGVFQDASDLEKSKFGFLFRHIPSNIFRFDISSTEIRAAGGKSYR
eukprot:Phypoly_transcript_05004.p1 GENE.Phypoly_transcript_05004~~Phypoly_transcript_05004.p1  ORF type:complete len:405 (+),score=73.53 Phypoly_transcript_05004:37-1251(+)